MTYATLCQFYKRTRPISDIENETILNKPDFIKWKKCRIRPYARYLKNETKKEANPSFDRLV